MSVSQTRVLAAAVLADPPEGLVRLGSGDALVVTLYFAMVIGIGFYLKQYATTSEDFFLAGRDMSSWIVGLSFVAANLGALELMAGPRPLTSMESPPPPTGTGSAPSRAISISD